VVLDELGAGTDPQEGAAIARAILSHLIQRGVTTFVATHYPELKTFAHSTEGVVNASLEFDIQTLRPTYHLTIGLPGRSNALLIAQRLGLEPEIIDAAKQEINPADLRADKLLDDIRKERNRTSREREKLEKARSHAEQRTRDLERELEKLEDQRREVLGRARAEGELEVAVLRQNIDSLKVELKKARQPLDAVRAIEEQARTIQETIEAPVERHPPAAGQTPSAHGHLSFALGQRVLLPALHAEGILTALAESDAEVQIGSLRMRVKLSELQNLSVSAASAKGQPIIAAPDAADARKTSSTRSPGVDISLRGKVVEDGLDDLEKYLEQAYGAGLPFVRIIHGKGTGRMRDAVRLALKANPYVNSFEEARENEGGAGVTIAKLIGR
jgi:DNA mismatch repair protein MutS2